MTPYIRDWIEIIDGMATTNTYKPCWGRALVECVVEGKYTPASSDDFRIDFYDIAENMVRYYWNQSFFFNLKQQPGNLVPTIYQDVNQLINEYKALTKSNIPCWSDIGLSYLEKKAPDFYVKRVQHVALELNRYVCYLFLHVNGTDKDIYHYDKNIKTQITLTKSQINEIKSNAEILNRLLNYKWAKLLDKFNVAPNILQKIEDAGKERIERQNLSPYKKELLKYLPHGEADDFYSGQVLSKSDITLDHVIPWSFMYRDDIWNLVMTSRTINSSKSNSVPSLETISRLEKRNDYLLGVVIEPSFRKSLQIAHDENLLRKFYYELTA